MHYLKGTILDRISNRLNTIEVKIGELESIAIEVN